MIAFIFMSRKTSDRFCNIFRISTIMDFQAPFLILFQLILMVHSKSEPPKYLVKSPHTHVCSPTSVPLGLHCSEMCSAFHDGFNTVNLTRIGKYQADSPFPCFGLKVLKDDKGDFLLLQVGLHTDKKGNIIPECKVAVRNGLSPKSFAIQALDDNGYPAGIFELENCEYSCKYCKKSDSKAYSYKNVITSEEKSKQIKYSIQQCRTDVESFIEDSKYNVEAFRSAKVDPAIQTLRVEFTKERFDETHNSMWFYWRIDELQFKQVLDIVGSNVPVNLPIAFTLEMEFDYKPHIYSSLKNPDNPSYIYTIHSKPITYEHKFVDTKSENLATPCADQFQSNKCTAKDECSELREVTDHLGLKCCIASNKYLKEVKPGYVPDDEFTIPTESHTTHLSNIYNGCNATKKCVAGIYYPNPPINVNDDDQTCITGKVCEVLLTIGKAYLAEDERKKKGFVYLELYGQTSNWVAVGISHDLRMGNDFVVECVKETASKVFLYTSFNYIDRSGTRRNVRLTEKEYYQIAQLIDYEETQKEIYCSFLLPVHIDFKHLRFRLDFSNNVIFAMGAARAKASGYRGNIDYHATQRYFYRKNVTLASRHSPLPYEQDLLYSHGQLMIAAWVFFLPIGTFIGRYFKQTYLNISFLGYKLWLWLHVLFSLIGMFLLFCGYFTLSRSKRDWTFVGTTETGSLHLWTGLISSSLAFTNMFSGSFIGERSKKQKLLLLEWTHGLWGHATYFAGFACLIGTPKVILSGVPCGFNWVMIIWIIVYFIFHCLMSYHFCWIDFVLGKKTRLVPCFYSMNVIFPEGNYKNLTKDEPGTIVRTYMLLGFIGMSFIFWLAAGVVAGNHTPCYNDEDLLKFALDYA